MTGLGLDICIVTLLVIRALAGIHRRRSRIGDRVPGREGGTRAKPSFPGERWIAAFHRITTSRSGDRARRVRPPPPTHDKETAINPTTGYDLATARAAELRSQAQRDALARAARHARTHKLEHAAPTLAAAGRRLLTSLRLRGT